MKRSNATRSRAACLEGFVFFGALILHSPSAYCDSVVQDSYVRTSAGQYSDQFLKARTYMLGAGVNAALFDINSTTQLDILGTNKTIQPSSRAKIEKLSIAEQGNTSLTGVTANMTQNLGDRHALVALGGIDRGDHSTNQSYGAGYQIWPLKGLWRLGIQYKQNSIREPSTAYTDVDGKRVVTPENIDGQNIQASSLANLSTRTIVMLDYSQTQRSDRPSAFGASGQVRQYIDFLRGALHAGVDHYENVGSIEPITSYGEVVADSYWGEWHQKIASQWIAMGGYRFYRELEKPRADQAPRQQIGSDQLSGSLRHRFEKSWSIPSHEINFQYSYYSNNLKNEGHAFALGIDLFFANG